MNWKKFFLRLLIWPLAVLVFWLIRYPIAGGAPSQQCAAQAGEMAAQSVTAYAHGRQSSITVFAADGVYTAVALEDDVLLSRYRRAYVCELGPEMLLEVDGFFWRDTYRWADGDLVHAGEKRMDKPVYICVGFFVWLLIDARLSLQRPKPKRRKESDAPKSGN